MPAPVTFDLAGEVALVTGATSGFGRHFADVLSAAGASVVLTGRRVDRLEALRRQLVDAGRAAHAVALDVTSMASMRACVSEAERAAGAITVLVNNAGISGQGPARELREADWDAVMDTNVKGVFFMAQLVGSRMIAAGVRGRIVNVASIGAERVLPGLVAYCASKAAVAMLTKGLAREWARYGIAVNALCPGYVKTEINAAWFESEGGKRQIAGFPRRRLAPETSLDAPLLMLCSRHAEFVTGSLVTIDDGQRLG
ncbi:MAG: short-chain dehydrogenase [Polyangiaceae bacterium UTPRO1]|jgi:NAD(P)-dependent dehydrogenase (short-subunit alcohol dehydrogenase family)|nr:SDR family NAD(P)-dependent oxidoreductase [Myxococcales bacterium]OQY66017.1 MAG: short-chain dehydrogenase [Polyangiaceae bacterium UTPRO1]